MIDGQKMETVPWAFQSLRCVCAIMQFIVFQFVSCSCACVCACVPVCVYVCTCVVICCLSTFELSSPAPRCLFSKAAHWCDEGIQNRNTHQQPALSVTLLQILKQRLKTEVSDLIWRSSKSAVESTRFSRKHLILNWSHQSHLTLIFDITESWSCDLCTAGHTQKAKYMFKKTFFPLIGLQPGALLMCPGSSCSDQTPPPSSFCLLKLFWVDGNSLISRQYSWNQHL